MWAKVDDKLFSHPKWLATSTPGKALWVSALSWCASQENDGHVPAHVLSLLGATKAAARSLVASGLWEEADGGYAFHDWIEYQPDAASTKAKRAAESDGGKRGAHTRWHVKKRVWVPECQFCQEMGPPSDTPQSSDGVPHGVPDGVDMGGGEWGANAPVPDPTRTRIPTDVGTTADPRNARGKGRPEARPQPEFQNVQAVLAAVGMAAKDRRPFLVHLRRTGADNPAALVNSLHRDGKLAARIEEWRLMADVEADAASRPGPGPTDRQALILRAEMERARTADAAAEAQNVIPLPQIGGTAS